MTESIAWIRAVRCLDVPCKGELNKRNISHLGKVVLGGRNEFVILLTGLVYLFFMCTVSHFEWSLLYQRKYSSLHEIT